MMDRRNKTKEAIMVFSKQTLSRRRFLKRVSLAATVGVAAPMVFPSRLFGAESPSHRATLAHIGVGGQGSGLLGGFRQTAAGAKHCDLRSLQGSPREQGTVRQQLLCPGLRPRLLQRLQAL